MDNQTRMELNKLRQLIDILQQQLQTQQTEIESVKEIALKAQARATSHWHFVGTDATDRTFFN
jgi:hypothetical protein